MNKQNAFLHSVIEVPKGQSIRCQAPGCTASVWKAIHVVVMDGDIQLYGSTCFKKTFEGTGLGAGAPSYGSATGRVLTDAERLMLMENTSRLIALLEEEHHEEIAQQEALRAKKVVSLPSWLDEPEPDFSIETEKPKKLTRQVKEQITAEAKRRFREQRGLDPDQPGWIGLVMALEAEIREELGYE